MAKAKTTESAPVTGWSWGGAMFSLLYLALSRRMIAAVLLTIALFVPFLNFVVMIVLFIWGGLKGRAWLASDSTLTPQQRANYADFFDRVGLYFFWVSVVIFAFWLVFVLIGIGGFFMSSETQMQGMEFMQGLEQLEQLQRGMEAAQ